MIQLPRFADILGHPTASASVGLARIGGHGGSLVSRSMDLSHEADMP
jgi:hypothetical protein